MSKPTKAVVAAVLWVAALALTAAGQQPRVTNGVVQIRTASAGLESEFRDVVTRQIAAAWIGYSVSAVAGRHDFCCAGDSAEFLKDQSCDGCSLEERASPVSANQRSASDPVRLEGSSKVLVLFRVEHRLVGRIRVFSEDCPLDAGGLPFIWLTDVRPSESVALLTTFVGSGTSSGVSRDPLSRQALGAIAVHGDQAAETALERFVARDQPDAIRRSAAFWLGAARGHEGFEVLAKLIHEDPSDSFRRELVFPLSLSKTPEAISTLIEVARRDASPGVRGQALFWLSEEAGRKVASTLTDAIARDPDTDVKKRAVFALSRLPRDEGVPLLVEVARTNRNPAVRKQAMFWLGQSKDPRALAFFEQILTR